MKTLTVSACRRPLYTGLVLSSLAQCDGIDDYWVHIVVDSAMGTPEGDAVARVVEPFLDGGGWSVSHTPRAGCNQTVCGCVDTGFSVGGDFHIHVEDDTLLHKDFLRFMEWAALKFSDDQNVLSVSGYNTGLGRAHFAHAWPWFTPWGWGTWRNRWDEMRTKISVGSSPSWDCQMDTHRGARMEVVPALGLVQNIGENLGTHNHPEQWSRDQFNPVWAGSVRHQRPATWEYQGVRPK